MKAEEAKTIAQNAKKKNAIQIWEDIKEVVFAAIKTNAENRCDSIRIGANDKLAKHRQGFCWFEMVEVRDYVKQELESLGYKFSFDNDDIATVTISWW